MGEVPEGKGLTRRQKIVSAAILYGAFMAGLILLMEYIPMNQHITIAERIDGDCIAYLTKPPDDAHIFKITIYECPYEEGTVFKQMLFGALKILPNGREFRMAGLTWGGDQNPRCSPYPFEIFNCKSVFLR